MSRAWNRRIGWLLFFGPLLVCAGIALAVVADLLSKA